MEQKEKKHAEETAKRIIPLIEKEVNSETGIKKTLENTGPSRVSLILLFCLKLSLG